MFILFGQKKDDTLRPHRKMKVTEGPQTTETISDWCIVVIYPHSKKPHPGVDRICTLQIKPFFLKKPRNSIYILQDFPIPCAHAIAPCKNSRISRIASKVIPPLDSLSDGWYKEKGPRADLMICWVMV